jgi:hypothetical protein
MQVPKSKKPSKPIRFSIVGTDEELEKAEQDRWGVLNKSVHNSLAGIKSGNGVTRLSFQENPNAHNWVGLWVQKQNLVPDFVLKNIAKGDSLVATILQIRSNHISQFGRELQDRHGCGFVIEPRRGVMERATEEQKTQLNAMIAEATATLSTCGSTDGVPPDERMSLATFLGQQARNALLFGRFATEMLYLRNEDGTQTFHYMRPLDAGTIYRASPGSDPGLKQVRQHALALLERLNDKKLVPEKFETDEYAWVQVIDSKPYEGFTADECFVHDVFPVTDIEYAGYPMTPIDIAIDEITTHMNITTHNRLYFESGRAARGMIVIKSADIDQDIVAQIRQHFNASINGVKNSWRVPVFGIDPEEEIAWEPLELQGPRDQEFQFLYDMNARSIMSAFQVSPDEVPGYGHLSKPTGAQSLSESDNEYKLEAARDTGIRPLLVQFQDFLNDRILPLINETVSKLCVVKLMGLEADSPEREQQRLIGDSTLHETYDSILTKVEKQPIGKRWGGEYPMSPGIQGIHDRLLHVGEIREKFLGIEGASKDPQFQYVRDPFWFNFQQLQLQQQQLQQQQQMAEAQSAQGDQQPGQEGQDGGQQQEEQPSGPGELESGVDQLMQMLNKSEAKLPPNKRRLLAQHRMTVKSVMDSWEKESIQVKAEVLDIAKKAKPKKE